MKKTRTLIMLLLVFILTAAFGKETQAACNHTDALGHSTWEFVKYVDASCTAGAYQIMECSICHARKNVNYPDSKALGHNWDKWQTSKKATCTAQGQETRKCKRCSKTETRTTKALGHSWGKWQTSKKATCTAQGQETRKCTRCSKTETRTTKALGHKWGEWKVTKEPYHGQPGEETRTCSSCKKTETRSTAAEKALADIGDSGIIVVVAQELLKDSGEYTGECDGIFREDLAAAIKAYEKKKSLPETGAIHADTLSLLADDFWITFNEDGPATEDIFFVFEESRIRAYSLRECKYTPNGDGTHKVDMVVMGFHFNYWKDEQVDVIFPDGKKHEQVPYDASCRMDGDKPVCKNCGADMSKWQLETVELNLDALLASLDKLGSGIVINCNIHPEELTHYDLPLIEGLHYDTFWNPCLKWDPFPGALRYDVYVWQVKEDENGHDELLIEDCIDGTTNYDLSELKPGKYIGAVLAKDDSGAVSDHTLLYFSVVGDQMPAPTDAALKTGVLSWHYEETSLDPVFHITLLTLNEGENEYYETDTENNWVDLTPVFMEMAVKDVHPQGIQAVIVAKDANGALKDSEETYCPAEAWKIPSFYRVLSAVNVRKGPGKNFERLGGYSPGDYFITYETEAGADGIYYVVNYMGQTGYVLSSCATGYVPKLFTVHVDIGNGRSAEVFTNPDGTINWTDLMDKVQRRGYLLTGLERGHLELDLSEPLQPGDALEAVWKPDPAYVFVSFSHESAMPVEVYDYLSDPSEMSHVVPVRIGTTFRIRMDAKLVYSWYWRPSGTEDRIEVTDDTPFTAEMKYLTCYERKSVTLGKKTVTGREERLLYLYSVYDIEESEHWDNPAGKLEKSEKIGRLQEGDVLTIQKEIRLSLTLRMYKVHVDRLNKDGYIYVELLDGLNTAESYTVYFDANGGYCPVAYMSAIQQKGYAYPTIAEMPVPSRSGYLFAGWEDAKGNPVNAGYDFTKSMTLKAKWIDYLGSFSVKQGLTISLGDKPFDEQTKPYGFATPTSKEKIKLPVCEEVQVIGETQNMYQCLWNGHGIVWVEKRFIATDYDLFIYDAAAAPPYTLFYWGPDDGAEARKHGEVGRVFYKGSWVSLFYNIGGSNSRIKVAIPNALNTKDERMGSGVAWLEDKLLWRIYRSCRVTFWPGEGVTWLDYIDVYPGKTIPASEFPIASLSGYEFLGWYTDPVLGERVTTLTPITESMTLYAHYKGLYDDYRAATEKAPIYDRPSTSEGNVIGYVKAGEVIIAQRESKKGLFVLTTHDGVTGWVQTRYLESGDLVEARIDYKVDRAIRSKPKNKKGTAYRNIESLEVFLVIGEDGSYYKVAYPCEKGYAYIAKAQLWSH